MPNPGFTNEDKAISAVGEMINVDEIRINWCGCPLINCWLSRRIQTYKTCDSQKTNTEKCILHKQELMYMQES